MPSKFFDKTLRQINSDEKFCHVFNFSIFSGFLKLFLSVITYYKKDIAKAKLFTFISSLLTLLIFILSGYLFSHLYDIDKSSISILFLTFFILIIGTSIFTYLSEIQFNSINIKALAEIMPFIWKHIFSLPISSFNLYKSTEILKMFSDYESAFSSVISTSLNILSCLVLFIMLFIFMFYCNFYLTLLYLFIYIILTLFKLLIFPIYMQHTHEHLALQGHLSGFLNESLLQIHKIRTSDTEQRIHNKWLELLLRCKMKLEKSTLLDIKIWLVELITRAALLLIMYVYLYLTDYPINTSTLIGFLMCSTQLTILFERISTHSICLVNLLSGLNRLSSILNEKPEFQHSPFKNKSFQSLIRLSHVSLKKSNSLTPILEDISISITPGSFVALVGPSGAGKSSIFKLILGLTKPSSGIISIDGVNINDIDQRDYRKQFGVVLQTSSLLPGTIYSNISANTKITLDEAWKLASYVGLEDDIKAMPMKMHTYLSDNPGDSISGGQKQKILIARALASQPKILLLDEATSALDNTSQALVFNNLKLLNITLVVIAHRLSTIEEADVIYSIENGRIIDEKIINSFSMRVK